MPGRSMRFRIRRPRSRSPSRRRTTHRGVLRSHFLASDDYGLTSIALLLSRPGAGEEPERIELMRPAGGTTELDDSAYPRPHAAPVGRPAGDRPARGGRCPGSARPERARGADPAGPPVPASGGARADRGAPASGGGARGAGGRGARPRRDRPGTEPVSVRRRGLSRPQLGGGPAAGAEGTDGAERRAGGAGRGGGAPETTGRRPRQTTRARPRHAG